MGKNALILRLCLILAVLASLAAAIHAGEGPVRIQVALAPAGPEINRGIFSVSGFPPLYARDNPLELDAFYRLGPAGTQTRIETLITLAEPENDDGDPAHINPAGFRFDRMHRFVENDDGTFLRTVKELGMEPVLLLGYNAPWLSADGTTTSPPVKPEEWAEFAAAVVEHYNGRGGTDGYRLNVRYVEIWNNPGDRTPFWSGTRNQYHKLFNTVAARLHRDYPGVMVGGPSFKNPADSSIEDFILDCGAHLDYLTAVQQNETPAQLEKKLRTWAEVYRDETGRQPRIMITEGDNYNLTGADKFRYLMERQFRLLDLGELVLGYHQFCLPYFQEVKNLFGMVYPSAATVPYNYYPYYAFRSLRGRRLPVNVAGAGTEAVRAAASLDGDGSVNAVLYGAGASAMPIEIRLALPGFKRRAVLEVTEVGPQGKKLLAAREIAPGAAEASYLGTLGAGRAIVLTAAEERPQDAAPVVELDLERDDMLIGTEFTATARVINTTAAEAAGQVFLAGAPADWEIAALDSREFKGLKPGAEYVCRYRVKAASPADQAGLYAFVPGTAAGSAFRAHSIPQRVVVQAPLAFRPWPHPVYAAPGRQGELFVEIANTYTGAIKGQIRLGLPEKWGTVPETGYELAAGGRKTYRMVFPVDGGAKEGAYELQVGVTFGDLTFTAALPAVVLRFNPERRGRIVGLEPYYNADGITSDANPKDYIDFGGPFTYAAEFMPPPGPVKYLGITFAFPDGADGRRNVVRVKSQEIAVPEGNYAALAALVASLNGDKKTEIVAAYADGTREAVPLKVTDWCVAPKNKEFPVNISPHRHMTNGDLFDANPQILLVELPLQRGKTLQRLVLPKEMDLYFFALTLLEE